ncbi:MAG: FAD-dependent oxidoreductase [Gammaproteobacteria bacterium]|nr:FAD-dependent oxidoreductase [Gammaproteobacteria bacterium]
MNHELNTTAARVVVIGGGVVGCSVLYHLAKAGWTDVVLIERDELTSGSSWHAAGSLFSLTTPANASILQKYAIDLYAELGNESGQDCGYNKTGELWLALSEEEVKALKVIRSQGRRNGIFAEFVTPREAKEMSPILSDSGLAAVLYEPDAGFIDPSGVTHAFAKAARKLGAKILRHTPVTATVPAGNGEWDVVTDKGSIRAEFVVNAAGLWAREVAAMAGIELPLLPVEHHYMVTESIAELVALERKIPSLSFSEANVYARQEGNGLLLGAYERKCVHWAENGTPQDFGHELLPNDLERMEENLAQAIERIPCLEATGIKRVLNGPMIFSPDLGPLLGPHPSLRNYYCATGVMTGFNQGPGIGKVLAEWIVEGEPSLDVSFWDVARFGSWANKAYTKARTAYFYEHRSDRIYPNQDFAAGRPLRETPVHESLKQEGAVFAEYDGFEDPVYFARNAAERTPRYSFERANWFDAVGEEARAVRDSVGLFDFSTFAKYLVTGPRAQAWLDHVFANRIPSGIGKMALMPMLSPQGRIAGDFTLSRLDDTRFLLIGAGAMQRIYMRWFGEFLPASGVVVENVSGKYAGLHIAGPEARSLLAEVADADVGNEALPFLSAREMPLADTNDAIVARVSFTGELGYEMYIPWDRQLRVFDALREAGKAFGLRLAGSHALMSLRLEKSFPSWGLDLASDYYPDESGIARFIATDKGEFIGREAFCEQLARGPREKIATFIIDADGADAFSGEPVYCNGELAGYVTSGGYGYRVGKSLALGYLSAEFCGKEKDFEVELLGNKRPARLSDVPVYDPEGARMKA